ncbi:MAG: hypothetical protein DCC88_00180 [Spirobacillus cienkowskii]|uniref:Helix-turn-helix domain-containing protein n=1 Tax=Spirobacillus cienkowskii TaxID=495820 RepID=A0A369KX32_9BACT|nr:MAG: hypothetical protein DCC88_00180 [Spirobacillus cienkowskii]
MEKLYDVNSGGRSLNAIWKNEILNSSQKLILHCIASHLDFRSDFKNWLKISISKISSETSFAKRTVQKVLKELIDLGYINKKENFSFKTFLQEENSFCFTDKIFNKYFEYLIRTRKQLHDSHVHSYNIKDSKVTCDSNKLQQCIKSSAVVHHDRPKDARDANILPSYSSLNLIPNNYCVEKNSHTDTVVDKKCFKSIKQASIIVCELLKQKLNKRFIPNFECEDIIKKAVDKLKIDKVSIILSFCKAALKNNAYNKINNYNNIESIFINELEIFINNNKYLDSFESKIETIISKEKLDYKDDHSINKKTEKKLEVNIKSVISEYNHNININDFPVSFKNWYNQLPSICKRNVKKEIKNFGKDKFLNYVLPSINSYKPFINKVDFGAIA